MYVGMLLYLPVYMKVGNLAFYAGENTEFTKDITTLMFTPELFSKGYHRSINWKFLGIEFGVITIATFLAIYFTRSSKRMLKR